MCPVVGRGVLIGIVAVALTGCATGRRLDCGIHAGLVALGVLQAVVTADPLAAVAPGIDATNWCITVPPKEDTK